MSLFFNNDLVHCVYFCVNPFQDKTNLLHLWCTYFWAINICLLNCKNPPEEEKVCRNNVAPLTRIPEGFNSRTLPNFVIDFVG